MTRITRVKILNLMIKIEIHIYHLGRIILFVLCLYISRHQQQDDEEEEGSLLL